MKSSKLKILKTAGIILFFYLLVAIAVYLLLPSGFYLRQAFIHLKPKITQCTIFNNRVVRADDPEPWDFADDVEDKVIPDKFKADFDKYKTVAFLVVQHKKIIFEQYWGNFSPLSYTNSFSMTKSLVSLLVGCAIRDGYIKSVDEPVSDFLPEWTSCDGNVLTIKDLLTMSAGVDWDEAYNSPFSKTTKGYYGNDLWGLTETEKLIEKPGIKFNYQSGATQILGFLLQKATKKTLSEYASERIWTPIHAEEDALWSLDRKDGMEKAFCCFNSNARDFARLGQLVLNQGSWEGDQLIDSSYIQSATAPATWLTYTPKNPNGRNSPEPCGFYGYQFWILNYKGVKVTYFRGLLGQYIFVIPQMDAVIVRLGKKEDKDQNYLQNYTLDIEKWLDAGFTIIRQGK